MPRKIIQIETLVRHDSEVMIALCNDGKLFELVGSQDEPEWIEANLPPIPQPGKKKAVAKKFAPPTIMEVKAYCTQRNNSVDAEQFVNFYSAKGWKVGNSPMKDWKACVRTWEQRDKKDDHAPEQAWWTTASGIEQKGRELGVEARPGETFPNFKARVMAAAKGQ